MVDKFESEHSADRVVMELDGDVVFWGKENQNDKGEAS